MDVSRKKSDAELLVEVRIAATNIFVSLPQDVKPAMLTLNSKLPFKAASLREVLAHRVGELSMVAVDLYECRKLVPAFVITRAVVETVAMTYWLHQKVSEFLESKNVNRLDEFLMRVMMGSRDGITSLESYNILTAVDKMNKEWQGFRKMYDGLCEFSHPNWAGTMGAYGRMDREAFTLFLGSENGRAPVILGLAPFEASLKLFEHYYNDLSGELGSLNTYFENQ